jgi:hypothetical protein
MRQDVDALPLVGAAARLLGVRRGIDVIVDAQGMVRPKSGGKSVAPNDPLLLPMHRRPPELAGTGRDPVWSILIDDLDPRLTYRPDPDNPDGHGFIEPKAAMTFEEFQETLATSRSVWELVESLESNE